MTRHSLGGDRCCMPTSTIRFCTRKARVFYMRAPTASAPDGSQVAAYCAQHDSGSGRAALLRVLPWEYDYRYDQKTGEIDGARVARKDGGE